MNKILIWDETLRDGEQSPGVHFSVNEKVQIAKMLDAIGINFIDIGFPCVSEEEIKATKQIISLDLKAEVGVTIRLLKEDILQAIELGVKNVFMFAPTSNIHIKTKFNFSHKQMADLIIRNVHYAITKGLNVYFISEDTSRSEMTFITNLFNDLQKLGVKAIILTDTVGIMYPTKMKQFIQEVIRSCDKSIVWGVHCHNDFGLATANTLAAIEAGITIPTLTINGIGERSGNAALEEVVVALEKLYNYNTNIRLKDLYKLSIMTENFSMIPLAANKAVVGDNSFKHESGIHINSLLKSLDSYIPFPPEDIGRCNEFVYGKHSGKSALLYYLKQNKILVSEAETKILLSKIKETAALNFPEKDIHEKTMQFFDNFGVSETKIKDLVKEMHNGKNNS